jgi:hypothetical protein
MVKDCVVWIGASYALQGRKDDDGVVEAWRHCRGVQGTPRALRRNRLTSYHACVIFTVDTESSIE